MGADTSTIGANLKKYYLPGLREQTNDEVLLTNGEVGVPRGTEHVEGDEWVMGLHIKRSSGVGFRAETDNSPTPGNQGYVQAREKVAEVRGHIEITERAILASATSKGSFTRNLSGEMDGIQNDAVRQLNRSFAGTSNGVIATCGDTSSSTTVVLASTTPLSALLQLQEDIAIDIGTLANPTSIASARTISAVDETNKTITISGAAVSTTAGAAYIFLAGSGGDVANSNRKETYGLQTLVGTGTLFNVDPSTYGRWKSAVVDAAGAAATDTLFNRVTDDVRRRSGMDPDLWLTSVGVYRNYGAFLTSMKRSVDTLDLKGGHQALSVSSGATAARLYRERDIPDGMAFLLKKKHLAIPEMADWNFLSRDGAELRLVDGTTKWRATLIKFCDLAVDRRNCHGRLYGIAE